LEVDDDLEGFQTIVREYIQHVTFEHFMWWSHSGYHAHQQLNYVCFEYETNDKIIFLITSIFYLLFFYKYI
jgi:hypothetical protein